MARSIESRQLKSLCLLVIMIGIPVGGRAELPPWVYQDLQGKSPEALTIKVESVKVSATDEATLKRVTVTAEARVEAINRTASGLQPGAMIHIRYVHLEHKEPLPGPSEPDVLQKGRSYPAFLSRDENDDTYRPAARGYSFRKMN